MATKLLERAFQEAASLPEDAQNEFAVWVLEELAHEARWNHLLKESQQALSQLAAEARQEYRKDDAELLDPDDL